MTETDLFEATKVSLEYGNQRLFKKSQSTRIVGEVAFSDGYEYALKHSSKIKQLERELAAVTEQRDRLADLVKQFIYILDITEESDGGRLFHPTNITSCRAGDLQKAGQLVEALRRAVKGGSDEPQG